MGSDDAKEGHSSPEVVVLMSGKRKSGKDFVAEKLLEAAKTDSSAVILRLSAPLKKCYAEDNGLDYEQLMTSGSYKEEHRAQMIKWSEEIRNKDYGYFCRASIEFHSAENNNAWIVSDCRRPTDLRFFEERYSDACLRVRVRAPEAVRRERGWVFAAGVDDADSECALDGERADVVLDNDGKADVSDLVKQVMEAVRKKRNKQ